MFNLPSTIMRTRLVICIMLLVSVACSDKKKTDKEDLKVFMIEDVDSRYDLGFKFPKSIVSIKEMETFDHLDTTDNDLNWIFDVQYDNPELDCFYDSLDTRVNIIIHAGPRLDISNKQRSQSYFSVPTVKLDKIFPVESDSVKIIFDSGKKTYKDKTYFKRIYKRTRRIDRAAAYYFISSKWHSALVIVNSPGEVNLDRYVLDFLAYAKQ